MGAGKGPDEIYCRTCGEPIKRAAEICPECGVRNEGGGAGRGQSTFAGPSRETIFCRSCGEEIMQRAEICPNCGVANSHGDGGPTTSSGGAATAGGTGSSTTAPRNGATSDRSGAHDPADYSTTVSEHWRWGVAASLGCWILGMALPVDSLAGMFLLVGWVLMPVSVYYDAQWLRANTTWNPRTALWAVGSAIWLLNIVVGLVYLVRRHGVVSAAETASDRPADEPANEPLAELRRRYSRGEIDDAEFEARVEKILETEDEDTARLLLDDEGSTAESRSG